jgi:5-methylcytosine-specific restriction endonuclease McrA
MKREQIKAALDKMDYSKLTQQQVADLLGCYQTEISSCIRYYGMIWDRKRRDQLGEKNHQFKDGLGRSTIERLTRAVVKNDNRCLFTCERCGAINKQEQPRHHKDRNRANNDPKNIEVLCWGCHNKEHMSEKVRAKDGTFLI